MGFQSWLRCSNCGSEDVELQMKGSENDGVYCHNCGYNSAGAGS